MMRCGPMFRRGAYIAGVALLCLVLPACKQSEPPITPRTSPRLAADTSWGTFHVRVTPQPDPIPFNQMFTLAIAVTRADNHAHPATDTTVAVDARMPAHNHGMNLQPRVAPVGDGTFRAEGLLFHMPGQWELYVDVTRAAEMERATFVIDLE